MAGAAAPHANGAGAASALTVDATVLNCFWELASVQAARREAAAQQLASELSRAQREFEEARSVDDDDASRGVAPLVSYSLRRLTRGLGSGREGARQGFALAFAGALAVLPCVGAKAALDILHAHSEPVTGSAKGSEAREIYLGKLFGYGAIVRAVGASALEAPVVAQLAQEVAVLARKKGYLREVGATVLLQLLSDASTRTLATVLQQAPALAEWLCSPLESAEAETVLLAVELGRQLSPSAAAACAVLPPGGTAELFDKSHFAALLPALLSSTTAHPRVHSVWKPIVKLLSEISHARAPAHAAHAAVETFWDAAGEGLFQSSHERKFLGFKLFAMLLPALHPEDVPVLFSQLFMRCLVNNLTNANTLLHASASECLANLLQYVQTEAGASVQTSVIAALQRYAGGRFDRLTHTAAVSTLMDSLAPQSAGDYVGDLCASFLTGHAIGQGVESEPAADTVAPAGGEEALDAERRLTGRRVWAIEQLCGVCRSPRTPAAVHLRVMRFLLVHAFFDVVPGADSTRAKVDELRLGAPSPPLAPELRQLCATRLFGLLADALLAAHATIRPSTKPGDEGATAEAAARKQRGIECAENLDALLELCGQVERMHTHARLVQPLQGDASSVRKAVRALLPSLDSMAAAGSTGVRTVAATQADAARQLLRVLLLLQLSVPQDFTQDMADLPRCLQTALGIDGGSVGAAENGDVPHHMDVLVEVLLSLLAKPSAILRDVVERTFRAFAASVSAEGVRSMLRVVTRGVGRRNSEEEGSEADESDGGASGSDEDEVEENGESSDDEDDRVDSARPAQPDARGEPSAAAAGSDDDSDDGEGMEDDAMFKADSALAAVLSLAKAEKSQKKAAAEALTHFKFRVLSLLETFIKAQPSSPVLSSMLVPLLRALIGATQGATASNVLAERVAGVIVKSLCKAPVTASSAGRLSLDTVQSAFATCMRRASRSTVPKVASAALAACQYLLRVLWADGKDGEAAVAELVHAALTEYFTSKKCRLPYAFFTHALDRFPAVSGGLVDDCVHRIVAAHGKDARTARDEFATVQALKLIAEALHRKTGSAAASATAATVQPASVLHGATLALGASYAKAKRQAEAYKHAMRCADGLRRMCASQDIALPAAEVAGLKAALSTAKAGDPVPPRVAKQLEHLLAEFSGAAAAVSKRPVAAQPAAAQPAKRTKR